jgi:hypothetical protein
MNISKAVFWNETNQKVRWIVMSRHNGDPNFIYVGEMTEPEFDLLIEVLFELFDDIDISLELFMIYFSRIRKFCDEIKELTENL